MTNAQRLNFLAELVRLPHASFHFNDDATLEEIGDLPVGYTIRVDSSCKDPVQVTAPTFPKAVDLMRRELRKAENE
jgi:hypothetical protein